MEVTLGGMIHRIYQTSLGIEFNIKFFVDDGSNNNSMGSNSVWSLWTFKGSLKFQIDFYYVNCKVENVETMFELF